MTTPRRASATGRGKDTERIIGDNDSLRVLFVVGAYFSDSVGAVKRPCQRER